jgi:hypothetical protein
MALFLPVADIPHRQHLTAGFFWHPRLHDVA